MGNYHSTEFDTWEIKNVVGFLRGCENGGLVEELIQEEMSC